MSERKAAVPRAREAAQGGQRRLPRSVAYRSRFVGHLQIGRLQGRWHRLIRVAETDYRPFTSIFWQREETDTHASSKIETR